MVAQGKAIAGGVVMMTAGAVVLSATLLAMNGKIHRADKVRREILADMSVKKKKKPPVKKKIQRRKPPPKRSRPSRAPRPTIASDLGGLGGGVPMFSANVVNRRFTHEQVIAARVLCNAIKTHCVSAEVNTFARHQSNLGLLLEEFQSDDAKAHDDDAEVD